MKDFVMIIKSFSWVSSRLSRKSRSMMLVAFTMVFIGALINSVVPTINGKLIDTLVAGESGALNLLGVIALAVLGGVAVEVAKRYLIEKVATKTQKDLVVDTFDHTLRVDLKWLKSQQSGGLNGRIQRSVEGCVRLLKIMTMDFAPNIMRMLLAAAIALVTNVYIGAVIAMCVLIGILVILKQIHSQKGIRLALLKVREKNDSNMVELLSGIEAVRVADDEDRQIRLVESINEALRNNEMNHHKKMILFDAIKTINIKLWYIVVLLIGVVMVSFNLITAGEVVAFTLLFTNVANPLQDIHRFIDEAHEASLKTQDLKEILSKPIDKAYYATLSKQVSKPTENAVEIKNLSFGYEGKRIFNAIDCPIKKGKYVGIVGTTGSGKSTLISLMMRVWPVENESLYVFDRDINSIPKKELSDFMVYMPQTPFIFKGTIRENLLCGTKGNPSDTDLLWALDKVDLLSYLNGLKEGLDYVVEERGSNMSGGQRQRLALARVFLRLKENPFKQIIILDEATSALDKHTEQQIIDNLLELKKSDTTIISIAHNLETLASTDEIIKLDRNTIQTLTYHELLKDFGLPQYGELCA